MFVGGSYSIYHIRMHLIHSALDLDDLHTNSPSSNILSALDKPVATIQFTSLWTLKHDLFWVETINCIELFLDISSNDSFRGSK